MHAKSPSMYLGILFPLIFLLIDADYIGISSMCHLLLPVCLVNHFHRWPMVPSQPCLSLDIHWDRSCWFIFCNNIFQSKNLRNRMTRFVSCFEINALLYIAKIHSPMTITVTTWLKMDYIYNKIDWRIYMDVINTFWTLWYTIQH